jgi:hypothetical protein
VVKEGIRLSVGAWTVAVETASVTRALHRVTLAKPVEGERAQQKGNPEEGGVVTTKQWFQVEGGLDVFIRLLGILSSPTSTWNHCFVVSSRSIESEYNLNLENELET